MKENKFPMFDKTVVWLWDESIAEASKLPVNNLYILDSDGVQIWNMHDTLMRDDICVGLRAVGDSRIKFTTFSSSCIEFDVDTLSEISRMFVK